MTKSTGFQFKQFFIRHDRCAMKVNTDGILLGALADTACAKQILDLGTGSGLVAIMLAQRTHGNSRITALELEPNAYRQAVENARNSAWSACIDIRQGDVLAANFAIKFDLIVANPPYFADGPASRSSERDLARAATQSHLAWLQQAQRWLAPSGKITLILPFEAGEKLIAQSEQYGLYCVEHWQISTKEHQPPKRLVVSFSHVKKTRKTHSLAIYNTDNQYTEAFKALTGAFYLKM